MVKSNSPLSIKNSEARMILVNKIKSVRAEIHVDSAL